MTENLPPKDDLHPLSRMLFGWAFIFKRGGVILVGLVLASIVFLVAEIALDGPADQISFEDWPGFHLAAGAIVVAAVLLAAWLLKAAFGAAAPAEDEP
jgi:hypothetical protein